MDAKILCKLDQPIILDAKFSITFHCQPMQWFQFHAMYCNLHLRLPHLAINQPSSQITGICCFKAVSAKPLRVPCVEMKYSKTDKAILEI